MANRPLDITDYMDPGCPFCTDAFQNEPPIRSIPIDRILERLDADYARNDTESAERHLDYWLREAEEGRDLRGELFLRNERMGFFRKAGRKEEAFENAERALELVELLEMKQSVTAGTTLVNAATVFQAFEDPGRAVVLFEKARTLYEGELSPGDERLGGLYNNMALTLTALARYREAAELFSKALSVMSGCPGGEKEMAVTYLNLASCTEAEKGLEEGEPEIGDYLEKASGLLESPLIPRDGEYAFVCEKCAPVFGYYGWFLREQELKERAEALYAGA
ncbi:MAG: tetratricopeptide repeat protein [Clostridia bacterium]|nr:tetratricopeptide repeat protein [Clostridia bacterium]